MNRWQSNFEKYLLGSLFLLLMVSSMPGLMPSSLSTENSTNLSSLEVSSSKTSTRKIIENCIKADGKTYDCKLTEDRKDPEKTILKLSPTEGGTCKYGVCDNSVRISKNIEDIADIEAELSKKSVQKKIIAQLRDDREDRESDDRQHEEEDPIWKKCKKNKGYSTTSEKFLRCAMNEFIALLKSKKDEYDPEDFKHLFDDHIKDGLEKHLGSSETYKRREYERYYRDILSKLRDYGGHQVLREEMLALKSRAFIQSKNDLRDILREANEKSYTDPVAAISLLNQFSKERFLLANRMQNDMYGMNDMYRDLLHNNNTFSYPNAYNELRNYYALPVMQTYQGLWHSNLFPAGGYSGSNLDFGQRLARIQGEPNPGFSMNRGDPRSGGNFFPPSPIQQNSGYNGGYPFQQSNNPPYAQAQPGAPWGASPSAPTNGPMATYPQRTIYSGPYNGNPAFANGNPGYFGPTVGSTGSNNIPYGPGGNYGYQTTVGTPQPYGYYDNRFPLQPQQSTMQQNFQNVGARPRF